MGKSRKGKRAAAVAAADADEQVPSAEAADGEQELPPPRSADAAANNTNGKGAMADAGGGSRDSSPERDDGEAARLKTLNGVLLRKAAEERDRAAALEARLGELHADAAALADGEREVLLAAMAGPLRAAEEERAALRERLAEVQEALRRAEAAAAAEAKARDAAAARLGAAVAESGQVQERLAAMDARAAAASKRVAELEAVVAELEDKSAELHMERGELVKQLEATEASARAVRSEMAEVEESFSEFKKNSEGYRQEMEGKLQEKLRELGALQSTKAEMEAEFGFLQAELSKAVVRNRELASQVDAKEIELAALSKEADKLQTKVAEVGEKHSTVVAEAARLRNEIDKLVKTKEAVVVAHDGEKKRMEAELEVLKEKVGKIQAEKDAAEGTVSEKDAEAGKLRDDLKRLRGSMAELGALYDDLKGKSSSLLDEKNSVLKVLDQEKAKAEKLRLTIGELQSCNSEKDLEIAALKAEVEDKGVQIDGLNEELEQLHLAVADAQRREKNAVWTWLCPATTTVLAAASFVYAARGR